MYFLRLVGIPRRIAGWNVSPSPPMYFLGLLGERHEEKEKSKESLHMVCKCTVNSCDCEFTEDPYENVIRECWYVTCHGMVCSYLLLLQSSVTIQTQKLDRVGKPRGFWSLFVVFSAFYFSKVFAYGLTFSMLSTRKEKNKQFKFIGEKLDRKHVKSQNLALHYHSMKLQMLSHTDLTSSGLEYNFLSNFNWLDSIS